MFAKIRAFFHFLAGGPFGRSATSPRTKRLKPFPGPKTTNPRTVDLFTQETYWRD